MKDKIQQHGSNNAVYGLGFIGAAIYFISNATTFWMGAFGCTQGNWVACIPRI